MDSSRSGIKAKMAYFFALNLVTCPLLKRNRQKLSRHHSITGPTAGPIATSLAGLLIQVVVGTYGQPAIANTRCPAALDRIERHSVESGETLDSVAAIYHLQPASLASFNPGVDSALTPGTTLRIPPFNGSMASANPSDSWQTLAERYGSRADILFEINGCLSTIPSQIFIPSSTPIATVLPRSEVVQLPGYPLAEPADIALSYGWQPHSAREELVFNNGIAFAIPTPREVRTVDSGTVAFIGEREGYGLLLVVNHAKGIQTRYANLSDIAVEVGDSITTNMPIGTVGESVPTYLYFEVRKNTASGWVAQDPGQYLPALELR